jgi:hypothetical protein
MVPMPALLRYAGYPLSANQFCFRHKGHGAALSIYTHYDGFWYFKCAESKCGIEGDVVQMWFLMVKLSGFATPYWNKEQACGDLMARANKGMIDLSIKKLEDGRSPEHPARPKDTYQARLNEMIKQGPPNNLDKDEALPKPVRLSVKQAILGLFPDDGYLMLTPKRNWHPIMMRDEWLANYSKVRPRVCERSFISSNYLSRDDANCSYDGMDGVERRWLVIEGDSGTLEQQLWIHKQLAKLHHLCCVCYSGNKSLHGWYFVEGYSEGQWFELYAEAIGLGISDCNTWRICQPVRLPNGLNRATGKKQTILLWNI